MTTESIIEARANVYNLVDQVNTNREPIFITNDCGKGAILIAEDDWEIIQETLHLSAAPGLTKRILNASEEPLDECSVYIPEEAW